jgi:hypothetical protein
MARQSMLVLGLLGVFSLVWAEDEEEKKALV